MNRDFYSGKDVLVVGFGLSGRAAASFLIDRCASVTVVDRHAEQLKTDLGVTLLSDSEVLDVKRYAFVVISPGVSQNHPIIQSALQNGVEVIGEIELACRHVRQPFLGITGTNGKTTVSLLVGHVLNHAGIKAKVLGNVGIPLIAEIPEATDETIVCELSSFQLETLRSKVIDAAVILNITPDHLDRYASMQGYARAKIQIHACMKEGSALYVGKKVYEEYHSLFEGFVPKTFGFSPDCDLYCDQKSLIVKENIELILRGRYRDRSSHDVENVMAAFALCKKVGVSADVFCEALKTFEKPPHRIEFVRECLGVRFYNDSKGTNPDAVMRAVDSLSGRVILIAGGVAKGNSFEPWLKAFSSKVRHIYAIGEAQGEIRDALSKSFPVVLCETLESAVQQAFAIAETGDCVLLSPGCASFDMFKNYAHRGDRFKEIVQALEGVMLS